MIRELSQLLNENKDYPLWGILLFTDVHANIIKTLRDVDYYRALNEITGSELALFTTILFPQELEMPDRNPYALYDMMPIWKEPRENKKIFPWFNIKDRSELPLLVIFGHADGNFYYQKFSIQDSSVEDAFNSLRSALSRISTIIEKNRKNYGVADPKEIFKQAQWEIKKLATKEKLKNFFEAASTFRGAIGI